MNREQRRKAAKKKLTHKDLKVITEQEAIGTFRGCPLCGLLEEYMGEVEDEDEDEARDRADW